MLMYIAGPMSGKPQFNYPAFRAVAKKLRKLGYEVLNPAEMDDPEAQEAALASADGSFIDGFLGGETWGDFLSRDVKLVADVCDGVVLLDDWIDSRGARLEAFIAINVQKPIYNTDLQELNPRTMAQEIAYASVNQRNTGRYG